MIRNTLSEIQYSELFHWQPRCFIVVNVFLRSPAQTHTRSRTHTHAQTCTHKNEQNTCTQFCTCDGRGSAVRFRTDKSHFAFFLPHQKKITPHSPAPYVNGLRVHERRPAWCCTILRTTNFTLPLAFTRVKIGDRNEDATMNI